MGELVPGSPPLVFTMKGEVDHTWDVVVTPEAQYRLVLEKLATDHPMNWIEIHIRYGDQYISSPVNLSGDRATIDFVGPQSGQINIVVYSLIGEGREDLGTFTIQILEIEPRVEIEGR
ncbi:MAG: hypothetical protein JXB47_13000 [Anaerolineae bacterium]|nr:hypothetical protein [Anaerolineae bacterium]